MAFSSLDEWLRWIEQQHPTEIDMGLERVAAVARRMGLAFQIPVITVAGTNGKGSCVALLSAIFRAAGYRCGAYTSPHLLRYNERVAIDGRFASDSALCHAFSKVRVAQADISLSYFEYGTLAALQLFAEADLDVLVLEVGLGGRLDAVNIIDPTVAIISSVDLDHQAWLGETREDIGREKAGVFRPQRGAVMGDPAPVASVTARAVSLGAVLRRRGEEFDFVASGDSWCWWGQDADGAVCRLDQLPRPGILLDNAASVLQALQFVPLAIDDAAIRQGLASVQLTGRGELILHRGARVRVNVAHNPAALRAMLAQLPALATGARRLAVFSVLADKAVADMLDLCRSGIDQWHIAQLQSSRALPLANLAAALAAAQLPFHCFDSVGDAFAAALAASTPADEIVVFGSFFTVAEVLAILESEAQADNLRGQQ